MRYFDFDLTIEEKIGDTYPIRVRSQKKGEAKGSMSLDQDEIKAALLTLSADSADLNDVKRVGGLLYGKLFQDRVVSNLYQQGIGQVNSDDGTGVRIRLRIEPTDIAALPWELLYDDGRDCFLAMSVETPLTRYIELNE